jgi:DNA-directed RNA polymerase subunit M/transcription elongation factor TFIIS
MLEGLAMSDSSKCPQCGAVMERKSLGVMHDKVMACSHCGYVLDASDGLLDSQTYDEIAPDGTRRKVTVQRKRQDSPAMQDPQIPGDPYTKTKEFVTDLPGIHAKTVVTTSVRHFNSNSSKFDERIRQLVESGTPINFNSQADMDAFKNMLPADLQARFKGEVGGTGEIKTTTFKKSFTISDPAAAAKILDQMSDLGDGKADAKLLKEIMDAAPGPNKTTAQLKLNPQVTVKISGSSVIKWIVIGALVLAGITIALMLVK